ncbi:uncharacterized protein B0I36DRAFT_366150 [Microdochium trichocladiopsis]|uniref:Uncharacterized protein n=1 Tax=Microdochium trichocladiopsis TaxID=1682393 RepID=A0A9P9BMT8_9PEZI|nr:uncharacterized protein B0I36DRAFT_366150 [Microdochium trichocladiopsis]KAH7026608.1 hypothetical protein B0I36DRAFT_366150 [Microdochium trichocladiopsis]
MSETLKGRPTGPYEVSTTSITTFSNNPNDNNKSEASTTSLSPAHNAALHRAVQRVLSTGLAHDTLAQILDGLPTIDVALDRYQHRIYPEHPLHRHTAISGKARVAAREIVARFGLAEDGVLPRLKNESMERFRTSAPGDRAYALALLELVAEAVHNITAGLFRRDMKLYDDSEQPVADEDTGKTPAPLTVDDIVNWRRPVKDPMFPPREPWPTLFTHPMFVAHKQYPAGVADMVGYWAEDRILGGVVLFDHQHDDEETQPRGGSVIGGEGRLDQRFPEQKGGVYYNSARPDRTHKIFRLSGNQERRLFNFILGPAQGGSFETTMPAEGRTDTDLRSPLPILYRFRDNPELIDPEFAVVREKVYRDKWERPPPRALDEILRAERDAIEGGNETIQWFKDNGLI